MPARDKPRHAAFGGTPEDLAARTAAEVAKWREIVRDARIEPG